MENRIYEEIWIEGGRLSADSVTTKSGARSIDDSSSNINIEWFYISNGKVDEKDKKYASICFNFRELVEHNECDVLAKSAAAELRKIIKEYGYSTENPLVVGLGNRCVQADSLGICVADKIARAEGNFKIFTPSIEALTGYPSFDAISAIVKTIRPSVVFIVDTLSAKSVGRLGAFLQMTNGGISAGSGVANSQPVLSERTLSVPVIAIGVPLVIYARTIAVNLIERSSANIPNAEKIISEMLGGNENGYVVTPTSVNFCLDVLSDVLSKAIIEATREK